MKLSSAPLKPQCSSGWFAAGTMMAQALAGLSDGAFKLFVYLCLYASRQTGSLGFQQAQLAARLGKSRRSIGLYLAELEQNGFCSIQPGCNQHAEGQLTITDAYWPYQRTPTELNPDTQAAFVQEVKRLFLALVPGTTTFTASDHRLACQWFHQQIALEIVEKAFLLAAARKHATTTNQPTSPAIRSLYYFPALLEEVRQLNIGESYWIHLRRQLQRLTQRSPAETSPSAQKSPAAAQGSPKEQRPC